MTKILWDQTSTKVYETGVDRGVLYLSDNSGVAWNGITSVEEDLSDAKQTPYYLDGVKYYNQRTVGDFSAILKAYTYPDEFLEFDGFQTATVGLILSDQPVSGTFGLSYRTLVGNDINGIDYGYKIHILYNLTATPSNRKFSAMGNTVDPLEFTWNISGIPEIVSGFRPTAHVILDSRELSVSTLSAIEDVLYGNSSTNPRIPSLSELVGLVFNVVDNGDGTWTATGLGNTITYLDATTFQIDWPGAVMISPNTYTLSNKP